MSEIEEAAITKSLSSRSFFQTGRFLNQNNKKLKFEKSRPALVPPFTQLNRFCFTNPAIVSKVQLLGFFAVLSGSN